MIFEFLCASGLLAFLVVVGPAALALFAVGFLVAHTVHVFRTGRRLRLRDRRVRKAFYLVMALAYGLSVLVSSIPFRG